MDAGERADSLRSKAVDSPEQGTGDASTRTQSTFEDQPLVIGAVGLPRGTILGRRPGTEREDGVMGSAPDRALSKARASCAELFSSGDRGVRIRVTWI